MKFHLFLFSLITIIGLCTTNTTTDDDEGNRLMKEKEEEFKIPNNYPHFNQCDPEWGDDIIISKTICKVGCLLSSVSMALNYYDITIDNNNQSVNPGTLNKWLKNNHGYIGDNNLNEETLEKLSPRIVYKGPVDKLSISETTDYLKDGTVTIGHVRNGTHFVLMTGYTIPVPSTDWLVNDPAFNQTVYTSEEIVNYRIFIIKPKL